MKIRDLLNAAAIICFSFCILSASLVNAAGLPTHSHEVLAKIPEANAALYAKKKGADYEDFILQANGFYRSYSDWRNEDNPTYAPKMFFDDISRDGKKDLTIILTTGTGSGVIQQQVHVLHPATIRVGKRTETIYDEVLVDNPMAIVLKNVDTKLSTKRAEITIEGRTTVVDIKHLQIQPRNIFPNISMGNYIRFDLVNHELVATIGTQVSPAAFVGEVKITYAYTGKMYEAKRIEFVQATYQI